MKELGVYVYVHELGYEIIRREFSKLNTQKLIKEEDRILTIDSSDLDLRPRHRLLNQHDISSHPKRHILYV